MIVGRDIILHVILAASTLSGYGWAAPTNGAEQQLEPHEPLEVRQNPVDNQPFVWRADKRHPNEIILNRGLWAKGYSMKPSPFGPDVSLYNHARGASDSFQSTSRDGYVSFTKSKAVAEDWIRTFLGGEGFIYEVPFYPNLIDVRKTLGKYSPHNEEQEFAAIKGVEYRQIRGWNEYRLEHGKTVKMPFRPNTIYNAAKYMGKDHGGAQYTLAGFPANHPAWREEPWSFYASCSAAGHKRASTTSSKDTSTAQAKDSGSSKNSCGPSKTNQQYAQEYYDAVNAGKKYIPQKTNA